MKWFESNKTHDCFLIFRFNELETKMQLFGRSQVLPKALFKRLPLTMISFHLLQTKLAWQVSFKLRSLSIFSTTSGGSMLWIKHVFILFAFPILKLLFKKKEKLYLLSKCDWNNGLDLTVSKAWFLSTSCHDHAKNRKSKSWMMWIST